MANYLISEKTRNDLKNLIANNTIDLTEGRRRSRAGSFARPSSGSDVYLCKITGGTTATGYTVDIYGNGYDSEATDTGTLQALDLAQSDDLPIGTRVIGHSCSVTITGGSEA